jgi:hypothetical protein
MDGDLTEQWAPARKLGLHVIVRTKAREVKDVSPLAKRDGHTVALQVKKGDGQIYLVDARVFSNVGLKTADNALFLAALAARHGGDTPIVFDEFVHGYGNVVSLLNIAGWPMRWGLFVGALALLLYALGIGRRLGAVSAEPQPARRASIEQIEALAAFFAAKNDRTAALSALASWSGKEPPEVTPRSDDAFVAAARTLTAKPASPPKTEKS